MRVHVIQLDYSDNESTADRRERVAGVVAEQQDADLIVLPELWPTGGFAIQRWRPEAESCDGPTWQRMLQAKPDGAHLHLGSVVERSAASGEVAHQYYNTSLLMHRDGSLAARYRKIHRYGFDAGEPTVMSAGRETVTASLDDLCIGLATCYDLRFPELFRKLRAQGAHVVLVPAAWPEVRVAHWLALLRARAIENQVWVVGANTAGQHSGTPMAGCSVVVAPTGDVIAQADDKQQIVRCDIDLTTVTRLRQKFPVWDDRMLGLPAPQAGHEVREGGKQRD